MPKLSPPSPLLWLAALLVPAALWAQGPDATLPVPSGEAPRGQELRWSTDPARVLAASARDGRPVYVYVWAKYNQGCVQMAARSLTHELVVAQLQDFELLALDAHNPANFPFFDKYKIPYYKMAPLGEEGALPYADQVRVEGMGVWPTSLFLDATGQESFRLYGFTPGLALADSILKVRELMKYWVQLREEPNSPLIESRLGHLYTQLAVYQEARKHLERALALDPENKAGLKADVSLDLLILGIPDNPPASQKSLRAWQKDNPRHARRLEALYYEAVSEVADNDLEAAVKLLAVFEKAAPGSPEAQSPWYPPAMQLLAMIRQQPQPAPR